MRHRDSVLKAGELRSRSCLTLPCEESRAHAWPRGEVEPDLQHPPERLVPFRGKAPVGLNVGGLVLILEKKSSNEPYPFLSSL